ncbi:MAG TPA: hypothetical protein VIQ31_34565 [Phormidium sp.]
MTAQRKFYWEEDDLGGLEEEPFDGKGQFDDNAFLLDLQKQADDRRKNIRKLRFFGTLGILIFSGTMVGGFALLVRLQQAPPDEGVKLSEELTQELEAQAAWMQLDQKLDLSASITPMQAEPGYRQTLAMSLGAKFRNRIQSRLNKEGDICNVTGGDVASCAYTIERQDVDKIRDLALAGKQPFLVHIEKGKVEIIRQLSQEEVLDWSNLNKQALDAAISQVNVTRSIDPFQLDKARDEVTEARIARLESENKTDAADRIQQAAIGFNRIKSLPSTQEEIEANEAQAKQDLDLQERQRAYLLRKHQHEQQQKLQREKAELKKKQESLKK